MASSQKRKDSSEHDALDNDFDGEMLDGVLSQSEDDEVGFENTDSEDDALSSDADETGSDTGSESAGEIKDQSEEIDDGTTKLNVKTTSKRGPYVRIVEDANGRERYEYEEIDPVYDSDDTDAQGPVNTIGNIPLSFYDSYPHIGYDINGKKIMRPATGEALDALLDSIDLPKGWTGLTDPETGKPLNLSQDELELLRRLQMGEVPEHNHDLYPRMQDMIPYFTGVEEKMPLSAAPEPKRRFVPSKHEAKRIAQLVRAIKEGRILPHKSSNLKDQEETDENEIHYDIWANEEPRDPHVMNVPAPKLAPPGYDLSYNPPQEYLPTSDEREAWEETGPEERDREYLPTKFDSLRKVPGYGQFIKERFERCLDLYLAPRVRKNRLNIDPNLLLPQLPKPEELRPFPTMCQTIFRGHEGRVRSVSFSPDGEWLASGGDDGTVRVWGINGHQEWMVKLSSDEAIDAVRWRPNSDAFILAAASGEELFFMVPPLYSDAIGRSSRAILDAGFGYAASSGSSGSRQNSSKWSRPGSKLEEFGVLLKVTVRSAIKTLHWHRRGDFVCSVSPTGQRSSVTIHTLSKHMSQIPFRRLPGLVQTAQFHPSRPLFFVATQRMIRCYDLQKQELVKVLQPGARWISSFDIHPGGDNLIVGSYDRRLLWHDLDLSNRPYKTMRFHNEAIRAVRYHQGLPLFADASDDGSLQIFHGKVVSDLMENARIVPVKMLKGHYVVSKLGVMDVDWHPRHPWCLSAGADGTCRLWT
ncbi:Ribosome bioproteinsis protein erb1 [Epichloe bromicola]|uniref:Ribosome biogenesis protein ERB1 n=1 Tax=Epichloe bromicola TaxID=79588 RepID=A0ABQ0CWQ6_9HYPO